MSKDEKEIRECLSRKTLAQRVVIKGRLTISLIESHPQLAMLPKVKSVCHPCHGDVRKVRLFLIQCGESQRGIDESSLVLVVKENVGDYFHYINSALFNLLLICFFSLCYTHFLSRCLAERTLIVAVWTVKRLRFDR